MPVSASPRQSIALTTIYPWTLKKLRLPWFIAQIPSWLLGSLSMAFMMDSYGLLWWHHSNIAPIGCTQNFSGRECHGLRTSASSRIFGGAMELRWMWRSHSYDAPTATRSLQCWGSAYLGLLLLCTIEDRCSAAPVVTSCWLRIAEASTRLRLSSSGRTVFETFWENGTTDISVVCVVTASGKRDRTAAAWRRHVNVATATWP